MHGIHGIGEAKLKNYGQQFLEVILGHVDVYGTKEGVGSESRITGEFQPYDNRQTKDGRLESKGKPSEEKKKEILRLLRETDLTSAQIAEEINVSPPVVWAYKAHLKVGTYGDDTDQKNGEKEK